MTCIVALIDAQGIVHFAGDALVVNVPNAYNSNVSQTVRREPKVWARDGMLFGANGSVRMLQLLRYVLTIPIYPPGEDKIRYLVASFIPALQDCFAENKYQDEELDGSILLALEGELFTIGKAFNVCNTAAHYDSVGKARDVALGSIYTTEQLQMEPQQRLYLALKAAERHTCVVSEPFTYISSVIEQVEALTWMGD